MSESSTPSTTALITTILTKQIGIALPEEQVADLWQACEARLREVGLDDTLAHIEETQAREPGQLDTLEREDVLTSLALVLAEQDWPSNAEIAQGKGLPFLQAMVDGMKARGYTPALTEN